jgi:hypothetical protein
MKSIIASFICNRFLLLCILYFTFTSCADKRPKVQNIVIDFTQAEMMLDFFSRLANGEQAANHIENILKTEGTELVIEQMNIVRRVTLKQYEQILNGLIENQLPDIEPADSSERALRGIQGLKNRVWLSLSWAIENTGVLRERMAILKKQKVYHQAKNLAFKYLPGPVEISPSLFVVMGGRAGAAAISGDRIYFDILIMTYSRVSQNRPFIKESEIIEFFAHEMHHIGLSKYYKNTFGTFSSDENENRLFGMLKSIVSEGSATYLINGQRNTKIMRKNLKLSDDQKDQNELLNTCEQLVADLFAGKFKNQEEFDTANTLMLGQGYHTIGAVMLNTIDQVGGIDSVMQVVADPRRLLIDYNRAAQVLSEKRGIQDIYMFNSALSQKAARL